MTTLTISEIDAQIDQQKSLIQQAQERVTQLQAQRVDLFVQTPVALDEVNTYVWTISRFAEIHLQAASVSGQVNIDISRVEDDADIVEYCSNELSELWQRHQAKLRGDTSDSSGIYCDGAREEAATRVWVFCLKSGGFVLLEHRNDKETACFHALATRYLDSVSIAYRITIEDGAL